MKILLDSSSLNKPHPYQIHSKNNKEVLFEIGNSMLKEINMIKSKINKLMNYYKKKKINFKISKKFMPLCYYDKKYFPFSEDFNSNQKAFENDDINKLQKNREGKIKKTKCKKCDLKVLCSGLLLKFRKGEVYPIKNQNKQIAKKIFKDFKIKQNLIFVDKKKYVIKKLNNVHKKNENQILDFLESKSKLIRNKSNKRITYFNFIPYLTTPYIKGIPANITTNKDKKMIIKSMLNNEFKILNTSSKSFYEDCVCMIEYAEKKCHSQKKEFKKIKKEIMNFDDPLIRKGIIHGDMQFQNIILHKRGYNIIDWENVREGPLIFDFATLFGSELISKRKGIAKEILKLIKSKMNTSEKFQFNNLVIIFLIRQFITNNLSESKLKYYWSIINKIKSLTKIKTKIIKIKSNTQSFNSPHIKKGIKEGKIVVYPHKVYLRVGKKCNNNCFFCNQACNNENFNKTTAQIKKEMSTIKKESNGIVITGGEPTLRKDLVNLIKYAYSLGFEKIQIQSNGRRFAYLPYCNNVIHAGANEFGISIHGLKNTHNKLTRSKSFEQTLKGIKNLKMLGKIVLTNLVITKQNLPELKEVYGMLKEINVDCIQFSYPEPKGNGLLNKKQIAPDINILIKILNKIIKKSKNNKIVFRVEGLPYCIFPENPEIIGQYYIPPKKKVTKKNINQNNILAKGYQKIDVCKNCKFESVCQGIYKECKELEKAGLINPIKC